METKRAKLLFINLSSCETKCKLWNLSYIIGLDDWKNLMVSYQEMEKSDIEKLVFF